MAQISQKHDFLTCSIQNFIRKVKQLVTKYYITWLIDLANTFYGSWKILNFILCHVLLKIILFYSMWLKLYFTFEWTLSQVFF